MFRFNYGEYIFQQLIGSELVQSKLTEILISLATNIVNVHIVTVICAIITIHPYIDFFVQIGISVVMALNIDYVYTLVNKYYPEFHQLTLYLINNYTIDNYRQWKRIIILTLCGYACLGLLLMTVTNILLFTYIVQYATCFLIVEQFEQNRVQQFIRDYKERPKATIMTPATEYLIDSYMSTVPQQPKTRLRSHQNKNQKPYYQQGLTDMVKSQYNFRKRLTK